MIFDIFKCIFTTVYDFDSQGEKLPDHAIQSGGTEKTLSLMHHHFCNRSQ